MSVLKPRNRIVVFRLTQEEYDALRNVSAMRGARNLSDFARTLLLGAVKDPEGEGLTEIRRALTGLQEVVGHMVQRIERIRMEAAAPEGENA